MTRNRKAELQRKLGMASLPTPPSDLGRRIKDQIPDNLGLNAGLSAGLNIEKERDRIRRSVTFDVRIAASILLLICGAVAGLYLRSPSHPVAMTNRSDAERSTIHVAEAQPSPVETARPPSAAAGGEPRLPPPRSGAVGTLSRRLKEEEGSPVLIGGIRATTVREGAANRSPVAASAADAAVSAPAAPALQDSSRPLSVKPQGAPVAVAESARKGEVVVAEAADAMSPAPESAIARAKAAPAMERAASKSALRQEKKIFTEPVPFAKVERAVRRGEPLDPAMEVAFIEHFASPADWPAGGLRLETESIALTELEAGTMFLRVSIDTPAGSSVTEIALTVDPAAESTRAEFRQATGASISPQEFLTGASTTRVYALRLQHEVPNYAPLASVRLLYRDAAGRDQHLDRRILKADVREWEKASARGRSASLAAEFLARLRDGKPVAPVAAMARRGGLLELAELIESAAQREPH